MKDKLIGMLLGGHNAEHEVSLQSGAALTRALQARGYRVTEIVVDTNLATALRDKKIEVAFIALHGRWGEDGCIQGLLEAMRIPYTGSGVLASALSMDKVYAKKLFRQNKLEVVDDFVVSRAELGTFDPQDLPFELPAVVKPSREGSSVGISIVHEQAQLMAAIEQARGFAGDVLIERYVAGREIQVGVLDDRALGAIEIVPAEEFYDYKAKYFSDGTTQYFFPAALEDQQTQEVLRLGLAAHQALGCSGVSRVDTILSGDGRFYLLEVNTIPGMTEASLIPKIAQGVGISFEDLAERLLLGASLKT
ncbi:MAG: D-alanine--D-alanine ligase [Deltaproteobacteria bacterium]|nr:D-alanine--D-alanine ligase [Deltaproteobacteria bacterium]